MTDPTPLIRRPVPRVVEAICNEPWAITPAGLELILSIAERTNDDIESVATRLGRPLDNTRRVSLHGSTALIPVQGPIARYANIFTEISGATSLEILARDFQSAIDDPAVSNIVLHLDSPGGQTSGVAEFATQITAASKPVTAYVGDLAASAAYWIAAQADEIVLSPTAMVGSIGVVLTHKPPKDGPLEVISSQSPLKRATPDTPDGRAEAQRVVDQIAAEFVDAVASGRRTTPERVLSDFGRGALLVGRHAVAAGMADRVATLDSLLYPQRHAGATGPTHRSILQMSETAPGAPIIDRAYLQTNHPDLLTSLLAEGRAEGHHAGLSEGAAAERTRIQSVRQQIIPGHEALIDTLAFDGKTTGPEAAVQVLAAERAILTQQAAAIAAAPAPVAAAERPEPAALTGAEVWNQILPKKAA